MNDIVIDEEWEKFGNRCNNFIKARLQEYYPEDVEKTLEELPSGKPWFPHRVSIDDFSNDLYNDIYKGEMYSHRIMKKPLSIKAEPSLDNADIQPCPIFASWNEKGNLSYNDLFDLIIEDPKLQFDQCFIREQTAAFGKNYSEFLTGHIRALQEIKKGF